MYFVQHIFANRLDQCLPVRLPEAGYRLTESFLAEGSLRRLAEVCESLGIRGKSRVFAFAPRHLQSFLCLPQMVQDIFGHQICLRTFEQFRHQENVTEAVIDLFNLAMCLLIEECPRALRKV